MVRFQCFVAEKTARLLSEHAEILLAIDRVRRGVGSTGDIESLNDVLDPAWPVVGVGVFLAAEAVYLPIRIVGGRAAGVIGDVGFGVSCGTVLFTIVIIGRQRARKISEKLPKVISNILMAPSWADILIMLVLGIPFYFLHPAGG
ncbi:hypothetical protein [Pseudofrankia inefficax]|uniref:hypothetical protein n=1 Tax=Pseudofrankia inefficax (strain DSM 45817 / CECT 9037 / DDB 130130 / EuI1c) TaxID=298654 RepID=UPI0012FE223B|nr:hypothetical protein [Pseudofrankia inefficax]